MKKIKKLSENIHYSAVNLGALNDLKDYSPESKRGKVFLKEATNASGMEISFTMLPPHSETPFFHKHRKNEETYMILKGFGFFQVDEDCFEIKEGSVIRVAPQGIRALCNTSDEPMIYVVVQSKENSLEEYTKDDGERLSVEPKWR